MVEIGIIIGFCILAYLSGSIPFGYLIAKWKGIDDIRKTGSGSTGGTNVSRKLGIKWGIVVGLLDALKSFLPTLLVLKIFGINWIVFSVIILAVLGHIFPVWLKFRAGKGVATAVGGLLLVVPPNFILASFALWCVFFFSTRYMSLSNLVLFFFLPIALWFSYYSLWYSLFGVLLFGIIAWAHRENIIRLIKDKEPKIELPKLKKP